MTDLLRGVRTVCLQIGNTDDRLKQRDWSVFVDDMNALVLTFAFDIHFHGFPPADADWQNACWVFDLREEALGRVRRQLLDIAAMFGQDSVALLTGNTEILPTE